MKKWLSVPIIFSLIFLAACGTGVEGTTNEDDETTSGIQELTIKISHVVAENTPKHSGALAMKEYIENETDGKIKVEVYPNSSLFGDADEYQNLVANNVQFIIPSTNKLIGQNEKFLIPAIPYLFDDDEKAMEFWDGEKGQEILQSLEKDGVIGLHVWPNGVKHLTNSKRPIKEPRDLEGLKLRADGGKIVSEIYDPFNVTTETIPFGDLYVALEQGVVDGQENPFSNIETQKFDEVQKFMTLTGHTRVDYVLLTNTTFWNNLNDETRQIIKNGVKEGTQVARIEAKKLNEKSYEKIKERGLMEIIELTPEQRDEFRKAFEHIYDKYEGVIGKDIFEEIEKINHS